MKSITSNFKVIVLSLSLSLCYSLLLAYNPIPHEAFSDRENYLNYVRYGSALIDIGVSEGIKSFIFNEPIWLVINSYLSTILRPEEAVRLIIFTNAMITSFIVISSKSKNYLLKILILIFPAVVGLQIGALRQGLASAIFLLAWAVNKKSIRIILFSFTPFIHSSFFIVLLLLASSDIINHAKNLSTTIKIIIYILLSLFVLMAISFLGAFSGARQLNLYEDATINVSGMSFLYWIAILILFIYQGKAFFIDKRFELTTILFYLTTYFLIWLSGRIFECTIVLVLLAGLNLRKKQILFNVLILLFITEQYVMRANSPLLGYGVHH